MYTFIYVRKFACICVYKCVYHGAYVSILRGPLFADSFRWLLLCTVYEYSDKANLSILTFLLLSYRNTTEGIKII